MNANDIWISPETIVPALSGLLASMAAYLLAYAVLPKKHPDPDPVLS